MRVKLPGPPVDAASGADSLWVLTSSTHRRPGYLARIDLRSGRLVSTTAVHGAQAVAFGWGSVWVAESFRNRVVRLDARSGRRLATIRLRLERPVSDTPDGFDFLPFDIAAGEGAIWVATARGSVARIDPATNRVSEQIAIPFQSSATIVVGEGAVWLAGDLRGAITIDPDTGEKTRIQIEGAGRRLEVGSLAVAGGRVWATGSWGAPIADAAGHHYVASDDAALAELSPGGRVLRIVRLPTGMVIAPSTGDSVWLSGWRARGVFVVHRAAGDPRRVLRLHDWGHVVAVTAGILWVAGARNVLVRHPISASRTGRLRGERPGRLALTTRVPKKLLGACTAAARQSARPKVYCPPLVPSGPLYVSSAGWGLGGRRSYALSIGYAPMRLASGLLRLRGNLILEGGPFRLLWGEVSRGRGVQGSRDTSVGGIPARVFEVAPFTEGGGALGDHTVVLWRYRGTGYLVGLRGPREGRVARAIARSVIAEMRDCTPATGDEVGGRREADSCRLVVARQSRTRPAPPKLLQACKETARQVTLPVYCPPAVPRGALRIVHAGPRHGDRRVYQVGLRRSILPGTRGKYWTVVGGPFRVLARELRRITQQGKEARIAGLPARFAYTVAPGLGGGELAKSTVFLWRYRGQGFLVGVHVFENRPLALAIARSLIAEQRSCPPGELVIGCPALDSGAARAGG